MEPVPETERMEEFRSSPLPTLRLQSSGHPNLNLNLLELDSPRKPPTLRRATDPPYSSPSSPLWAPPPLPYRPRTTSPLSGGHGRSRSVASLPPNMSRTQSMPGVNGSGHILYSPSFRSQSPILRPQSPSGSPSRVRVPRKPVDEAFPTSPTRMSVHDPERRLTERNSSPNLGIGSSATLARTRRPASPFRHLIWSSCR